MDLFGIDEDCAIAYCSLVVLFTSSLLLVVFLVIFCLIRRRLRLRKARVEAKKLGKQAKNKRKRNKNGENIRKNDENMLKNDENMLKNNENMLKNHKSMLKNDENIRKPDKKKQNMRKSGQNLRKTSLKTSQPPENMLPDPSDITSNPRKAPPFKPKTKEKATKVLKISLASQNINNYLFQTPENTPEGLINEAMYPIRLQHKGRMFPDQESVLFENVSVLGVQSKNSSNPGLFDQGNRENKGKIVKNDENYENNELFHQENKEQTVKNKGKIVENNEKFVKMLIFERKEETYGFGELEMREEMKLQAGCWLEGGKAQEGTIDIIKFNEE